MTFAEKIVSRITVDYSCLTVVRNVDGFLSSDTVRDYLSQTTGIRIVGSAMQRSEALPTNNLALRVDYELHGKQATAEHIVYLCPQPTTLLPDMQRLPQLSFALADLFPLLPDRSSLLTLSIEQLELLYEEQGIRRISVLEQQQLIADINRRIEDKRRHSLEHFRERISNAIPGDWNNLRAATEQASQIVCDAAAVGMYNSIEPLLQPLNQHFQQWIDSRYFAERNANPLLRPHSVNSILPHLKSNYQSADRVALIVVDGFAYWQYILLRQHLHNANISTIDNVTLAWVPTITMLSRQAIFRGDVPLPTYKQTPQNESRLWQDYWQKAGFQKSEIQYLYDTDEFVINPTTKRLALVTVELDEKMHSCSDMRDLYALTENWAMRFVGRLQAVLQAGFAVYLTTDHGSVFSHGVGSLSPQEKVHLFADGSRGKRHLIYSNTEAQAAFRQSHHDLQLLEHDNYLAVRNTDCFDRQGSTCLTHGGCHWQEVVIPFVKIER